MRFGEAITDGEAAMEKYRIQVDRQRAARKKRLPPMPPGYKSRGTCQWCDGQIFYPEGHKRVGQLNERRGWHEECLHWYKVAAFTDSQRSEAWHRGNVRCALCPRKLDWTACVGWKHVDYYGGRPEQISWTHQFEFIRKPKRNDVVEYSRVEPVMRGGWEADHIVPLWSLEGVTVENRGCFYGVVNLWVLCTTCHLAKTAREAAARAHRARRRRHPELFVGEA